MNGHASAIGTDSCGAAVSHLERDAAPPLTESQWRGRIRQELIALRDALAAPPPRVEGDPLHGPHAELCADAPRLAGAVHRLGRQRQQLAEALEAVLASSQEGSAARLSERVRRLVSDVKHYRDRVARLLHEAYTIDLGGER